MSARNYEETVKSAASGSEITKKETSEAFDSSFGVLADAVTEKTGIPGDQIPYWDPMGALNPRGEAIDMKSTLFEKYKPAFKKFNQLQRQGYSVKRSTEEVSKAIDSTSFSMPIFFTPDVHRTDQRDTPVADMIGRVAVAENEIKADEMTDVGAASSFDYEGASESWPENDDTYRKGTFNVVSYGRQNEVTDWVQISANTLRSTRALTEQNQVASIRHYEENQILEGTSGNDTTGFDGFADYVGTGADDAAGASLSVTDVRAHNRKLRRNGANYNNIVHVTDHKAFGDLKTELEDHTRYESPSETLNFGFRSLEVDGTPVLESHGAPSVDGGRKLYSFDMSSNYMGMLSDVTMHPLARSSPSEKFAVDAYGTLVAEAQENRVEITENLA